MSFTLPTPFSALIFDCDGTLVDTAPAHYFAITEALKMQGHSMNREWYMARAGLTPDALLDAQETAVAAAGKVAPLDRATVFATYNDHFRAGLHLLREVEAVASLARAWHGKVPMSVASNGRLANVQASLRVTGLPPAECVVLEDSDEGLHAASAAGMRAMDVRLA